MVINRVLFGFVLLFFLSSFSSANFACGEVLPTDDFSPSWMNVMVYYAQNSSDFVSCSVNTQNKFCCDLEDIESVSWDVGKEVFAEVYDLESGYVTNVVSLVTSEDSYDVFPPIKISKPLVFNNNLSSVLIQNDSILINASIHERYNNFRMVVDNSEGIYEKEICTNCTSAFFSINLSKGRNDISFVVYGEKEFVINRTFYVLDYFNVEHSFDCEGCRTRQNKIKIPANEDVNVTLRISTSDDFEGEVREFIPDNWEYIDEKNVSLFSESHDYVSFFVNSSESIINYQVSSPSEFLQRTYIFKTAVGDSVSDLKVYLYRKFWFGLPIYFRRKFFSESYYRKSLKYAVGPNTPLVIHSNNTNLNLVALYPKNRGVFQGVVGYKKPFLFNRKSEFNILTDFNDAEIEKILVQLKAKKGKGVKLIQDDSLVMIKKYKEDEDYDYYEGYLKNLDVFYIEDQ